MSYESTLEYIHNVKWQKSKPGLSRTRELLAALGNPEKKLKFVHIAGTNGKGSTAACTAAILKEAGYKTGLYTSPYIIRFNERMQINGEQISDAELEEIVDMIRPHAESMEDVPTEFEMITAVAMQYFYNNKVDIVVLEVGLGGELDSTNVIETPDCAVITAIGLDHTEFLGNTTAEIAKTKAGIIKENGQVAVYPAEDDVINAIAEKCKAVNSTMTVVDPELIKVHSVELEGCRFDFDTFKDLFVPLAGTYQPYNASLAITACRLLRNKGWNISDEAIAKGVSQVKWPGRFEVLRHDPVFILDGAHNPHGIKGAVESIRAHFGDKKLTFVIGVMADKDVENMIGMVVPLAKEFYTARPDNPRAMQADELARRLEGCGAKAIACDSVADAVNKAIASVGADGAVVALGSLYFSAEIREAVAKNIEK